MNTDTSIAQQYYKIQQYWDESLKNPHWKLAVWVSQYQDIEIISQYMAMESTVLGETEDIFLKFNSVYTDKNSYEQSLWNELIAWFEEVPEQKYDMHRALSQDGYLRENFVADATLEPTIENLLSEMQRFRQTLIGISTAFMIEFSLGRHDKEFGLWLAELLEKKLPENIRFVTIDIAEKRIINKFSRKAEDLVIEIHPQLDMLSAMKNELKKEVSGTQPHTPEVHYKQIVIDLMEALPDKKKMQPLINDLQHCAMQLKTPSVITSSYLIIAHAYNSIKEQEKGLKYIEKGLETTDVLKATGQWYPLWRSCMLFKAAFLYGLHEEEAAFEAYEKLADESTEQQDFFYVMEAYRLCASIKMKRKKYQQAFEYASMALYGGSFLDTAIRRNSTFLYAGNIAWHTVKHTVGARENTITLTEHLSEWLGADWEQLVDTENNINNYYVRQPEVPPLNTD